MLILTQIIRGVVISVVSASTGVLLVGAFRLSSAMLIFLPFTLFGAVFVLLPAYFWAKWLKAWSRRAAYLMLFPVGVIGSVIILELFILVLGGITAAPLPVEILAIGCLFAISTTFMWIITHYLTSLIWPPADQSWSKTALGTPQRGSVFRLSSRLQHWNKK